VLLDDPGAANATDDNAMRNTAANDRIRFMVTSLVLGWRKTERVCEDLVFPQASILILSIYVSPRSAGAGAMDRRARRRRYPPPLGGGKIGPDGFGDTEKLPEVSGRFPKVSGKIGLCGESVPKARPVLSSGVAGGKPGFTGIVCVAPPIPFVGAVVMELAAMTHVPDNINPTTVKPMEVSFIWYFLKASFFITIAFLFVTMVWK
jgi:hypothetical protein